MARSGWRRLWTLPLVFAVVLALLGGYFVRVARAQGNTYVVTKYASYQSREVEQQRRDEKQPYLLTSGSPASAHNMGDKQVTNIPYFTLKDGMASTLTLNNIAPSPTTVEVTIFNTLGRAQTLAPIVVERHSYKQIQLRDVIASEDFGSGNIQVVYSGSPMILTCQVSIFSIEKKISFESREQDMMDFMSPNLNGILWLPDLDSRGFMAVRHTAMID